MPSLFISYKRRHEASEQVVRELEETFRRDFEILRDRSMEVGKEWTKELYDLKNWETVIGTPKFIDDGPPQEPTP